MIRHIRLPWVDEPIPHDDAAGEATVRANCPLFFDNAPRGSRETIIAYRGGIIVRQTVQFTHSRPERRTVVYLYFPSMNGRPDTYHITSDGGSIYRAKRTIDRILETYMAFPDREDLSRSKNG